MFSFCPSHTVQDVVTGVREGGVELRAPQPNIKYPTLRGHSKLSPTTLDHFGLVWMILCRQGAGALCLSSILPGTAARAVTVVLLLVSVDAKKTTPGAG